MVDGILLGNTAAWTTQPTGLLNGLTPLAATAGGGVNALLGDIQKPLAAIAPAIKPVLIVNSTASREHRRLGAIPAAGYHRVLSRRRHPALDDAHSRLQHAKASPTKPAVPLRAMMVG